MDIIDVKADGHCGFRAIASLLGMGEESWPLIRMDLFKEISQWREEYATLLGGHQRVEDIKRSLLVDDLHAQHLDYEGDDVVQHWVDLQVHLCECMGVIPS